MVFSSLAFLCIFLPVVFLAALVLRNIAAQNVLLVTASLVFYAYGEPIYVLLMLAITAITYVAGIAIGKTDSTQRKRILVAVAMAVFLICLGVFKYADWFIGNMAALMDFAMVDLGITLPIGISFYTFQAISYVVDVYRGKVSYQRNVLKVMLYISFFPQLIAGPIIRYHDIDKQLGDRAITLDGVTCGLKRFIVGLAKKVLIADVLAVAVDAVYAADAAGINAAAAWLVAFAYMLQIYFDFSAYSDMAIGLARMFGFTYKENFNYPYISTSIKEFWQRWHISLSTWFKEYLYIPLGGNRRGRARTVINKFIVFFCCGLWHGAAWTFVVWGLIQGLFSMVEEYVPIRKLPKVLGWIYAMLVTALSFVIFRSGSIEQAFFMISQMWTGFGNMAAGAGILLAQCLTPLFICAFIVGIVAMFPVLPRIKTSVAKASASTQRVASLLGSCACVILLVLCMLTLAGGAYSPFIYFRF